MRGLAIGFLWSLPKGDLPFTRLGSPKGRFYRQLGKETDGLKFLDGRRQFAFHFMGVVAAAEADVFGGELAEVEFQLAFVPEAFVEGAVPLVARPQHLQGTEGNGSARIAITVMERRPCQCRDESVVEETGVVERRKEKLK